jgi:5'-3' exonuclease
MFKKIISSFTTSKEKVIANYRNKIREKAIQRAKSRIIMNRKDIADFSDEEIEVIVREEEDKIKDDFKTKGIYAGLALLGITII